VTGASKLQRPQRTKKIVRYGDERSQGHASDTDWADSRAEGAGSDEVDEGSDIDALFAGGSDNSSVLSSENEKDEDSD
jgi:hypothetical protein